MGIKCRIIKPLNKLVRRGEEDSSFCCMLTQYILFRLSSSVCFQYIFLWTSDHFFLMVVYWLPLPPPFTVGRLFIRLSCWKTLDVLYLQLSPCFVFALMQWWVGEILSLCMWLLVLLVWLCTECDVSRTSRSVLFCHVHSFPFLCVFVALPLSFAVML